MTTGCPRVLPRPIPLLARTQPYAAHQTLAPIDLRLDANEGPPPDLASLPGGVAEAVRRYPSVASLEALLAERIGVSAHELVVTAGGDDALDRACRAVLAPGRELICPVPTFEMIERWAALVDADFVPVRWSGRSLPTEAMLERITPATAMIAVVSPNNPTGGVASADDLRRLSAAAPEAMLLVDLAYEEFADEPLTDVVRTLPNALGVRTLSKAWGLAGLRIGYAFGAAEVIRWLRAAGGPFPVASVAAALAADWLTRGAGRVRAGIERTKIARDAIETTLRVSGAEVLPSDANFAAARVRDAAWFRDAMGGVGIAVRAWPTRALCEDLVRITAPDDETDAARVCAAARTVLAPEALLFDLDGVLADVSRSYRAAIVETAASFGVTITAEEVRIAKHAGNANNDWVLTQTLLAAEGVQVSLDEVTHRFEACYQGTTERPGLRATETLLWSADSLRALADRVPLAIVTGRPRADAMQFLQEHGIDELFQAVVAMEDGPAKPDPAPVREALERLDVERAYMIGDTVDDIRAARAVGVVPIGVCPPGEGEGTADALLRAGAARVLGSLDELGGLLP